MPEFLKNLIAEFKVNSAHHPIVEMVQIFRQPFGVIKEIIILLMQGSIFICSYNHLIENNEYKISNIT